MNTGLETAELNDAFEETKATLPGANLAWLNEARLRDLAAFSAAGLPTQKEEAWKYTNLALLRRGNFAIPEKSDAIAEVTPREGFATTLLIQNGSAHTESLSSELPDHVWLMNLHQALKNVPDLVQPFLEKTASGAPLADLSAAFASDGYVLLLDRNAACDQPIEIVFDHSGAGAGVSPMYHLRNLILAAPGSKATVIERHIGQAGTGAYLANSSTTINLARHAILNHHIIQDEAIDGIHISNTHVTVRRDAEYRSLLFSIGAALSRQETRVELVRNGGKCNLSGVYLMQGNQHADITTRIEHLAPETISNQLFKGALTDSAHGVFQGHVLVARDAQRIEGHQLNKTLLLSDRAEMNTKPELEIYADDVKCGHGATVGELDEEALFYLRSRGIPEMEARDLLIQAFLAEVLDNAAMDDDIGIDMSRVRDWFDTRIQNWRTQGGRQA